MRTEHVHTERGTRTPAVNVGAFEGVFLVKYGEHGVSQTQHTHLYCPKVQFSNCSIFQFL